MLSALLTLAALLAYIRGRELLEAGRHRPGLAWTWLMFPALAGLAMLAKENGALAFPLAALIEWVWFGRTTRRPLSVKALFALTLALPMLVVAIAFAWQPGRLLDGYIGRNFTFGQRLLTEPRILWDYSAAILVPNGPRLGLFHDHYPRSMGLFAPPSTALAIGAWLAVVAAAVALHRRAPAFAFGVGFFLVGHALESSVFPLEL
jgi:4-amino-4-deoxy-L-arabinose transferase-like glycosyltransferase